jgi:hypothetical protein
LCGNGHLLSIDKYNFVIITSSTAGQGSRPSLSLAHHRLATIRRILDMDGCYHVSKSRHNENATRHALHPYVIRWAAVELFDRFGTLRASVIVVVLPSRLRHHHSMRCSTLVYGLSIALYLTSCSHGNRLFLRVRLLALASRSRAQQAITRSASCFHFVSHFCHSEAVHSRTTET